jgi:hypothetical protein
MDAEAAHTNSFSELLARELDKVIEIEAKPGCRGEVSKSTLRDQI